MMVGCTHKGRIYDPPGVFETLDARKDKVSRGEGGIDDYEI